jgi:hypothetical protein
VSGAFDAGAFDGGAFDCGDGTTEEVFDGLVMSDEETLIGHWPVTVMIPKRKKRPVQPETEITVAATASSGRALATMTFDPLREAAMAISGRSAHAHAVMTNLESEEMEILAVFALLED